LKVIIHLTSSTFLGGPERQMLGLAAQLAADCRTVFLSFAEGGRCQALLDRATEEGFEARALENDTPRLRAAIRELTATLQHLRPALLCCHGYKAILLGRIAARRAGTPVAAVSRGWTYENLKVRAYEALERVSLRWMDRVVCVSEGQAAKVRRAGVPGERVVVIPNAIRPERFGAPDPSYRSALLGLFADPPARVVGAAGRLSPEKGFSVLVEAAASVARSDASVGFVVFGEGPLREVLQREIAAWGLEGRFVLAGFRDDLDAYMPCFDLLALPSYTEGLPNVVLEAFAAGVPVVATAVGGVPEVVENGVSGLLVPPGDPPALARAIRDVLRTEEGRRLMGARGRDRVVKAFTFQAQGERYLELCAELAAPQLTGQAVRVCFMIDRLTAAGTETQLVALIRRLDRTRVQPYLCLLDGADELSRSLEPADCPILRLGVRSLRHPSTTGKALRLARFLRRERIDVLQVYFPDSTYLGVPAARLAGVPHVIRTRNNVNHWMTPTHRRLGRLLNRFVTATVANCEACRRAVIADECPPEGSVVVLENGVDLSRFAEARRRSSRHRGGTPLRVGIVANLRPVKGLDVFNDAASLVAAERADVVFEIAGEGELRAELERQAAERGLADRLTLVGSVADVPAFLAQLDVAVLSSRSEGMSNAILEYMAAGLPIVATAVGGTVHLLEDGVHGLLVPPGDPAALAAAIGRLLRDPALASRLGAAARRRAEECFSREAMVRRFESFYLDLKRRSGPVHPEKRLTVRSAVKAAAQAVATVLTAPCWVPVKLEGALGGGEGWFTAGSELLSLMPGRLGIYFRRAFYRACLESAGDDCHIGFGTTIAHRRARIGRGVYIGNRCTLGQVDVEDHATIGSNVDILSGRHQHHFDDLDRPIQEQGRTFRTVRIGRNSWVGNSAVVMADVGSDCVIGAGSVVVSAVPDRSVAVGNPATVKKTRGPVPEPARAGAWSKANEGAGVPC
jgi:glycosyltransferase involved in cell wall biosynthesis/acetyltransferase-like isoleucine patch superfamily enzyme